MKRIRIIPVLLSAAIAVQFFAGCNKKTPVSSVVIVQTTAVSETTTEPPAPVINPSRQDDTEEEDESGETEEITTATTTTEETETETETTEEATPTPTPKPTDTPVPTSSAKLQTHVKDEAGVIKDDEALEAKLAEFEKATKIIPVVYTIKSDLTGDDFRTYTKNLYKSNFNDQNHFLIVYRVAKSKGGWSWTTSIGSTAYSKLKKAGITSTYSTDLSNALKSSSDRGKGFISFFDKAQKTLTGKE